MNIKLAAVAFGTALLVAPVAALAATPCQTEMQRHLHRHRRPIRSTGNRTKRQPETNIDHIAHLTRLKSRTTLELGDACLLLSRCIPLSHSHSPPRRFEPETYHRPVTQPSPRRHLRTPLLGHATLWGTRTRRYVRDSKSQQTR